MLKSTIFLRSHTVIEESEIILKQIDEKIDGLETINKISKNQNQIMELGKLEELMDFESLQSWKFQLKQERKRLLKLQDPLYDQLSKLFKNLADFQMDQVQKDYPSLLLQKEKVERKIIQKQGKEEEKIEIQEYFKSSLIHRFKYNSKDLHMFDIETEQYQLIKIQQVAKEYSRSVQYQNYIYLVGGELAGKPFKDTWQVDLQGNCYKLSDLNQERSSFGIAEARGSIFVAGGYDSNYKKIIKTVESLELRGKQQWKFQAPLPFGIGDQTLVYDDKEDVIYSFGGINSQGHTLKTILKFNVLNDQWLQIDFELPGAVQAPAAILQPLIVFGGYNHQTKQQSNKIYKRQGSEWQQNSLPEACICITEVKIKGNYAYAWMYSYNLNNFLVMKLNLETLKSEIIKKVDLQ